MRTIRLKTLFDGFIDIPDQYDYEVTGLALDSRKVKLGNVFFAYPGTQTDGRKYIEDAIANGAKAIICHSNFPESQLTERIINNLVIPMFSLQDLMHKVAIFAARFFDYPSKKLTMIGVTGTNGKTSITHFIAQTMQLAGIASAIIGTTGYGLYDHLNEASLTTPDPIELQRILSELVDLGAKNISMEVSSHSLEQKRVDGIEYQIAIYSNLSRDHLDYHNTMEEYANAKRKLFYMPGLKYAVINIDDEFGHTLAIELQNKVKVYTYSAQGRHSELSCPHLYAHQTKVDESGMTTSVHTPWGDGVLHTTLLGRFNLSNLLAVIAAIGIMGLALEDILSHLTNVHGVPGRMQKLGGGEFPLILVDYAHTPDALKKVLMAARDYCVNELWCIFGCGGNRDQGKRPQMGEVAESFADHVILTNDNPRMENPQRIINEILAGMEHGEQAVIEYDRKRAINHAIGSANAGDVIVIAGKGHENYQILGNEKKPFNDAVTVQMILTEMY